VESPLSNEEGATALATSGNERKPKADAKHITCSCFQQKRHYATNCPEGNDNVSKEDSSLRKQTFGATMLNQGLSVHPSNTGVSFLNSDASGLNFKLGNNGWLPDIWFLLDNQSTINVFFNLSC
jgi:hypothetical protein